MPQVKVEQLVLKPTHLAQLQTLLARHVPTAEVWAYGSRVMQDEHQRCHEGSDLDLVLRNPNQLQQAVENLAALTYALQQSSLPMLVDVHQWANLPESFHAEITRAYIVLQPQSDTDREALGYGE